MVLLAIMMSYALRSNVKFQARASDSCMLWKWAVSNAIVDAFTYYMDKAWLDRDVFRIKSHARGAYVLRLDC